MENYTVNINQSNPYKGAYSGVVYISDYDYDNEEVLIEVISPKPNEFPSVQILSTEAELGYKITGNQDAFIIPKDNKPLKVIIRLKMSYREGIGEECVLVIDIKKGDNSFTPASYLIDLQTPMREAINANNDKAVDQNNPICLGIETDESVTTTEFIFYNINQIKNCQCLLSMEAANKNSSIQEIKDIVWYEDYNLCIINWKPNNFLTQEKGLVKFAFQFYRLNKNGEYDFVLNTAPIYGYVHEGLNVVQSIGSNIYPSEIADLYSKYNSLLNDEDITDLDSFEDIKLYLQTLVPYNLDTGTQEANTNDTSNSWYVLAYSPSQKRYSYVPTTRLGLDAIYGQIWNAGEYTGIKVNTPDKEKPEMTWDDEGKSESSPTI